jgi:SAM-dependent methyltransferase
MTAAHRRSHGAAGGPFSESKMETVACNLCGSTQQIRVYEIPDAQFHPDEWFTVVECATCGLGFVNPRPTISELGKYYPASFYSYFETIDHTKRYESEAAYLSDLRNRIAMPRLLDVGCANGDFPRFMAARGWEVEGVEISPNAAAISDFPVYRLPFDQLSGRESHYDAVTAWAVLEHVHDPMAYFRKAAEVLRPGGLFVFLVTNFKSLSSKRLFQEDVPRHLYFFTEETVKAYAESVGLELQTADYSNHIYSMPPRDLLHYVVTRYVKRRAFLWSDKPENLAKYLAAKGLARNWLSIARYVFSHPATVLDRLLAPAAERIQILRRRSGIVVYITRRP